MLLHSGDPLLAITGREPLPLRCTPALAERRVRGCCALGVSHPPNPSIAGMGALALVPVSASPANSTLPGRRGAQ
jgi:hypothetical protein